MKNRKYDVSLSFASEDRIIAKSLAKALTSLGVKVFFHDVASGELFGKDLNFHLNSMFFDSRYAVILFSRNYKQKQWTNVEMRTLKKESVSNDDFHILPVKIDNESLPNELKNFSYIDLSACDVKEVANLITKRIKSEKITTAEKKPRRRTTYHVIERDDGWSVIKDGANRASSIFKEKNKAIEIALDKAKKGIKNNQIAEVIVHKSDGSIENILSTTDKSYPIRWK